MLRYPFIKRTLLLINKIKFSSSSGTEIRDIVEELIEKGLEPIPKIERTNKIINEEKKYPEINAIYQLSKSFPVTKERHMEFQILLKNLEKIPYKLSPSQLREILKSCAKLRCFPKLTGLFIFEEFIKVEGYKAIDLSYIISSLGTLNKYGLLKSIKCEDLYENFLYFIIEKAVEEVNLNKYDPIMLSQIIHGLALLKFSDNIKIDKLIQKYVEKISLNNYNIESLITVLYSCSEFDYNHLSNIEKITYKLYQVRKHLNEKQISSVISYLGNLNIKNDQYKFLSDMVEETLDSKRYKRYDSHQMVSILYSCAKMGIMYDDINWKEKMAVLIDNLIYNKLERINSQDYSNVIWSLFKMGYKEKNKIKILSKKICQIDILSQLSVNDFVRVTEILYRYHGLNLSKEMKRHLIEEAEKPERINRYTEKNLDDIKCIFKEFGLISKRLRLF